MIYYLVYRKTSEYSTKAEVFIRDISKRSSITFEVVDVDTRDGQNILSNYGILRYPVILVVDSEGREAGKFYISDTELPRLEDLQAL